MPGRKPLPLGHARTAKIPGVRVRPTARDRFLEACEKTALIPADATREALADWTKKILGK